MDGLLKSPESMKLLGVTEQIIAFCEMIMLMYKTHLELIINYQVVITNIFYIRREIYQGNSLPPLLFCTAMAALSDPFNQKLRTK